MVSNPSRKAKDDLYDAFASVAKALGSGRWAEIVELLAQGERSVEEVSSEIDQSVANTSHHLHSHAAAGLRANGFTGPAGSTADTPNGNEPTAPSRPSPRPSPPEEVRS